MFLDTVVGQSVEWEGKESGNKGGLTAEKKEGISIWMGKASCKVKLSWGPAPPTQLLGPSSSRHLKAAFLSAEPRGLL